MSKLFASLPVQVSIERQLECVDRELAFRRRVYERRIADGKMTLRQADEEIACMEAVRQTVKGAELAKDCLVFVDRVANFRPGGIDQDDDGDTINSLRARAREILGRLK